MPDPEFLHRRLMTMTSALHECSLSTLESTEHRVAFARMLLEITDVACSMFVIDIDKREQAGYSEPSNSVGNSDDGVRIHG